jgi:transcriptional regulator with XRE-family HTH domain
MNAPTQGVGPLLREWRRRRRRSQLEPALDAGVSARHISFLEAGRSNPSREMVIGLAANLDLPLRERGPDGDFAGAFELSLAAVVAICLAVAALVQLLPGRPATALGRSQPKRKFDGKSRRKGAAMR